MLHDMNREYTVQCYVISSTKTLTILASLD